MNVSKIILGFATYGKLNSSKDNAKMKYLFDLYNRQKIFL